MACCLLITLPLEFVLGARVYRRFVGLAFAIIPVLIIFSIWDVVGILRDRWSYSPRFTTGWELIFGLLSRSWSSSSSCQSVGCRRTGPVGIRFAFLILVADLEHLPALLRRAAGRLISHSRDSDFC
jgi:lycopene cyclase domain-containing protein